ncbi:septum site-determining protein MinD [Gloeobacter violaceus]|uniref:Septum site-determining protein MinD n=1 Tax=Gloeobacter violaceus (strain ATCC 29082 / PCC 7421) TaxID=251221 RepID=Q7NJ39_GLOVI|nr:septum site-determining protein MinD [Gloeobacter violaceus]BAC89934.1 septum site-determining protein [Gloeobacter violaceus PCC 7421]
MSGKVIVITSGKGGVGKTTSSANLGMALASRGKSVVLIDADFGLRNLDLLLGLENRVVYTILEVLEGECRLEQALVRDKRQPGLALLPAVQRRDKSAVTPEQMQDLTGRLAEMFNYVLIDCPAGIEQGFRNAISGAHTAIVVTTPEVSAVRDADRVIGLLGAAGVGEPRLVINRYRPQLAQTNDLMSVDDVLEILAVKLLGVVPEDEQVITTTNRGEPIVLSASPPPAGQAFINIARRLEGEDVPLMEFKLPASNGFIARLRALFTGR